MATVTSIQQKINKGFAKAATVLGDEYQWYRPSGVNIPVSITNYMGVTKAQFAQDKGLTFTAPADFTTADRWYAFTQVDALLEPGDYLVGQQGTYFITDIERFVSIHAVWTNRVINLGRLSSTLTPGANGGYSGADISNPTPILTQWPVSLRVPGNSGRARDPKMGLPTDALTQFYLIILPPSATQQIINAGLGISAEAAILKWNDLITDDLGRTYVVNGIEITPLGTRLVVEMWPT